MQSMYCRTLFTSHMIFLPQGTLAPASSPIRIAEGFPRESIRIRSGVLTSNFSFKSVIGAGSFFFGFGVPVISTGLKSSPTTIISFR